MTGSNFNSPFYDRIQTPLIRQYNLGIQYEFVRGYVLEAAYVGSGGINIANYNHVINTAQLASPSAPINGITTNTTQNASARVPYLGFLPNGLQQNAFDAVYNYNSLQTTVRKQFSRGFGFQAAYTWSKNLSNVGYDAANLNNPRDMAQQYGQTPYSRPHRFVVSYQYELPSSTNRGSIYGMTSSGTPENGVSRAQLCPGVTYDQIATTGSVKERLGRTGNATVKRFFNTSAFCAPNAIGNGTDFGSSGVGIVRGPGQFNFDFSVTKNTRIGETRNIQFRTEFFNLFNHAQFAMPSLVNNQSLYGSNPALLGVITGTSVNPRLIQFALRLQF